MQQVRKRVKKIMMFKKKVTMIQAIDKLRKVGFHFSEKIKPPLFLKIKSFVVDNVYCIMVTKQIHYTA